MGLLHLPGLVFIFVDAGFVLQMRETTLQPRKSLPLGGDEDEREDSEETDDGEQHVNPMTWSFIWHRERAQAKRPKLRTR